MLEMRVLSKPRQYLSYLYLLPEVQPEVFNGDNSVSFLLDVARPRSDARPDFRSVRAKRSPAGGPGKEAAQRQGT
eukprot:1194427-Prorocentrum_minimum.AAC.1